MSSQPSDSSDDSGTGGSNVGQAGLTGNSGEPQLKGRTLPPPWGGIAGPLSVTALTLEQQRPGLPVPRRKGPHAELATLEAQLRAADRAGDLDAERRAAMALSRALAARGRTAAVTRVTYA